VTGVLVDDDDDRAALAAFRNGDRGAFIGLVERYQRPVYNAALWILRRPEDAGDVTQTVFLKVIERLDEYDPRFRFFSWLYRIAVNEALDVHRRNGREEPLAEDADFPDADGAGPESRLSRAQDSERLSRGLRRLSTGDRTVLTLRHFSDLSYEEIAQILGVDEKTVKSRLFEARKRLRALIAREAVN
jgi:RNA polymerase sigma-70 factor (ECF subfamily)